MRVRTSVTGHRRAAKNLSGIARATRAQLDVAVKAAAMKVEADAKQRAPVKTGTLMRSVTHERE